MAAIITEKFRQINAAQFEESFSETNENYYMFVGKSTPFTSGTSGGRGANASASFSGAGGTCVGQGGNGSQSITAELICYNVNHGDSIFINDSQSGFDSSVGAGCSSCGTGCSFGCTAEPRGR